MIVVDEIGAYRTSLAAGERPTAPDVLYHRDCYEDPNPHPEE